MKKLKLFAMGLLGSSLLLTSCADDPDEDPAAAPILTLTEKTVGIANGEVNVTPGHTYAFVWDVRKGDADLENFSIEINGDPTAKTTAGGNTLPLEDMESSINEVYRDSISFTAPTSAGTTDYTFIVEDENGMTKSVTVTVNVADATTDLSAAQNFTWERKGGDDGTGLKMFGLKWTNNTAISAEVTPDGAAKLVMLNSADWTNITTVEELEDAIANSAGINEYTGVSSQNSGTYDDVLGVEYNGEVYMIHITDGTVVTTGAGTNITIDGQYKSS